MPSKTDSAAKIRKDRSRIYADRDDLSDKEKDQEYAIYSEALRRKKRKGGADHAANQDNLQHLVQVPLGVRLRPHRKKIAALRVRLAALHARWAGGRELSGERDEDDDADDPAAAAEAAVSAPAIARALENALPTSQSPTQGARSPQGDRLAWHAPPEQYDPQELAEDMRAGTRTIGFLTPIQYLAVAAPYSKPEKKDVIERLRARLRAGELIDIPTLELAGNGSSGRVHAHDGRHRVRAAALERLAKIPVYLSAAKPMPSHVVLRMSGDNARHAPLRPLNGWDYLEGVYPAGDPWRQKDEANQFSLNAAARSLLVPAMDADRQKYRVDWWEEAPAGANAPVSSKPPQLYLKTFLISDARNNNGWRATWASIKRLHKTFVGLPGIVYWNCGDRGCLRDHTEEQNSFKKNLRFQDKYKVTEIVDTVLDEGTHTAYAIHKVLREDFAQQVRMGMIRYLSPSIWPDVERTRMSLSPLEPDSAREWHIDTDGWKGLHDAFVDVPAFGPRAKIVATCEGRSSCVQELHADRALVAAVYRRRPVRMRRILLGLRAALTATASEWDESKHPRGQPDNAGQFAKSPTGGGAGTDARRPGESYTDALERELREEEAGRPWERRAADPTIAERWLGRTMADLSDDEINEFFPEYGRQAEAAGVAWDRVDRIEKAYQKATGLSIGDDLGPSGRPPAVDDPAAQAVIDRETKAAWEEAPSFWRGMGRRALADLLDAKFLSSRDYSFVSTSASQDIANGFNRGEVMVEIDGDAVRADEGGEAHRTRYSLKKSDRGQRPEDEESDTHVDESAQSAYGATELETRLENGYSIDHVKRVYVTIQPHWDDRSYLREISHYWPLKPPLVFVPPGYHKHGSAALSAASLRLRIRALRAAAKAWDESKHPRGQPGNPGQFAEVPGGGGKGFGGYTAAQLAEARKQGAEGDDEDIADLLSEIGVRPGAPVEKDESPSSSTTDEGAEDLGDYTAAQIEEARGLGIKGTDKDVVDFFRQINLIPGEASGLRAPPGEGKGFGGYSAAQIAAARYRGAEGTDKNIAETLAEEGYVPGAPPGVIPGTQGDPVVAAAIADEPEAMAQFAWSRHVDRDDSTDDELAEQYPEYRKQLEARKATGAIALEMFEMYPKDRKSVDSKINRRAEEAWAYAPSFWRGTGLNQLAGLSREGATLDSKHKVIDAVCVSADQSEAANFKGTVMLELDADKIRAAEGDAAFRVRYAAKSNNNEAADTRKYPYGSSYANELETRLVTGKFDKSVIKRIYLTATQMTTVQAHAAYKMASKIAPASFVPVGYHGKSARDRYHQLQVEGAKAPDGVPARSRQDASLAAGASSEWDEIAHPREPEGGPGGGQFVEKGGAGQGADAASGKDDPSTHTNRDSNATRNWSRAARFGRHFDERWRDSLKDVLAFKTPGEVDEDLARVEQSVDDARTEAARARAEAEKLEARIRSTAPDVERYKAMRELERMHEAGSEDETNNMRARAELLRWRRQTFEGLRQGKEAKKKLKRKVEGEPAFDLPLRTDDAKAVIDEAASAGGKDYLRDDKKVLGSGPDPIPRDLWIDDKEKFNAMFKSMIESGDLSRAESWLIVNEAIHHVFSAGADSGNEEDDPVHQAVIGYGRWLEAYEKWAREGGAGKVPERPAALDVLHEPGRTPYDRLEMDPRSAASIGYNSEWTPGQKKAAWDLGSQVSPAIARVRKGLQDVEDRSNENNRSAFRNARSFFRGVRMSEAANMLSTGTTGTKIAQNGGNDMLSLTPSAEEAYTFTETDDKTDEQAKHGLAIMVEYDGDSIRENGGAPVEYSHLAQDGPGRERFGKPISLIHTEQYETRIKKFVPLDKAGLKRFVVGVSRRDRGMTKEAVALIKKMAQHADVLLYDLEELEHARHLRRSDGTRELDDYYKERKTKSSGPAEHKIIKSLDGSLTAASAAAAANPAFRRLWEYVQNAMDPGVPTEKIVEGVAGQLAKWYYDGDMDAALRSVRRSIRAEGMLSAASVRGRIRSLRIYARRAHVAALRAAAASQWDESKHPRGQPENKGQFAKSPGGGAGAGKKKERWSTIEWTGEGDPFEPFGEHLKAHEAGSIGKGVERKVQNLLTPGLDHRQIVEDASTRALFQIAGRLKHMHEQDADPDLRGRLQTAINAVRDRQISTVPRLQRDPKYRRRIEEDDDEEEEEEEAEAEGAEPEPYLPPRDMHLVTPNEDRPVDEAAAAQARSANQEVLRIIQGINGVTDMEDFKRLPGINRRIFRSTPSFWRGVSADTAAKLARSGRYGMAKGERHYGADSGTADDRQVSIAATSAVAAAYGDVLIEMDGDAVRALPSSKIIKPYNPWPKNSPEPKLGIGHMQSYMESRIASGTSTKNVPVKAFHLTHAAAAKMSRDDLAHLSRVATVYVHSGDEKFDRQTGIAPTKKGVRQKVAALKSRLAGLRFALRAGAWDESKHPRGQPGNPGQFAEVPGGGAANTLTSDEIDRLGKQALSLVEEYHRLETQSRRARTLEDRDALLAKSKAAWREAQEIRKRLSDAAEAEAEAEAEAAWEAEAEGAEPEPEPAKPEPEPSDESEPRPGMPPDSPLSWRGMFNKNGSLKRKFSVFPSAHPEGVRAARDAWNAMPAFVRECAGDLKITHGAGGRYSYTYQSFQFGDVRIGAHRKSKEKLPERARKWIKNVVAHELGHAIWYSPRGSGITREDRREFARAVFRSGGPLTEYADSYTSQRLDMIRAALTGKLPREDAPRGSKGPLGIQRRNETQRYLQEIGSQMFGLDPKMPAKTMLKEIRRVVGLGPKDSWHRGAGTRDGSEPATWHPTPAQIDRIAAYQEKRGFVDVDRSDQHSIMRRALTTVLNADTNWSYANKQAGKYEENMQKALALHGKLTPREIDQIDAEIASVAEPQLGKKDGYISETWAEAMSMYFEPEYWKHEPVAGEVGQVRGHMPEVWENEVRPVFEKILKRMEKRRRGEKVEEDGESLSAGRQDQIPAPVDEGDLRPEAAEIIRAIRAVAYRNPVQTGPTSWSVKTRTGIVLVPDALTAEEAKRIANAPEDEEEEEDVPPAALSASSSASQKRIVEAAEAAVSAIENSAGGCRPCQATRARELLARAAAVRQP